MHRARSHTMKARVSTPYKKSAISRPISEDVEKATRVYGGSKYEMILVAALRSYELARGARPLIEAKAAEGHKPTVVALLEISAGHITKAHFTGKK
jgi:DNA-directed RNA polymerase omega subunit